ncbi:MAG: 30S ribosomal protein S4 [Candidatus Sumerlaeia bacterium]|nr:30S ribosomal protein S4 [Candidatus Sumerlaeia bacterium]
MARYHGPVGRLSRRVGMQLELKGRRREAGKEAFDRSAYPPGQHGQSRKGKLSTYGQQLREKQRAKYYYGVLERQFRRYFQKANRMRGVTGHNLMIILERRLDNVVCRLGLAPTRPAARQLVTHGHVRVNGRKVDIPSFLVGAGDVVTIKEKSRELPVVLEGLDLASRRPALNWLRTDPDKREGVVISLPTREDIPVPINEQMIVELYSK